VIFLQFVNNIALLVLVSTLYSVLFSRLIRTRWRLNLFNGLFFGLSAIIAMLAPVEASSGLFFDSRTVILAVGSLFGGLQAAILAVILAAGYRIFIGGIGALTGVVTIVVSAGAGILFRNLIKSGRVKINGRSLLGFGIIVHVIVLILFILIPNSITLDFIVDLLLPYFFIMPLATVLIGLLIHSEEQFHLQQLKAAETKILLENTLNNLHDALFVIKPGTRLILECNQVVRNIFGYEPEELIGRTTEILHIDKQHFVDFATISNPNLLQDSKIQQEYPMRKQDGSVFPAEVTVSVMKNEAGEWINVVSVVRDITDRKNKEEQLRFQAKLINSVGEAVIAIDTEGKVIFWNRAAEEIYGWKQEEIIGEQIRGLLIPDEYQALADDVMSGFQAGLSWSGQFPAKRNSGETFPALFTSTPIIDDQDKLLGTIAVSRDISEKVQAEIALQEQTDQLRAMARNMAELQEKERKNITRELHDQVGQMLAALGVNLSVMAVEIADEHQARLKDSAELVEQINNRIRNLMEDLRPSILDNYGLSAALGWYFNRFMQRTGIKIITTLIDVGQRLPDDIKIAFFRITQEVFTNISKHSEAQNVFVSFNFRGEHLILEIRDDGSGFDPLNLDDGGLGLIHMRERAESVGADFKIHSSPEEGTVVMVSIAKESMQ
jgi:PAS domain S-box-containing protein